MSALRKVVVLLSTLALLLVGAASAASASTPSSNPADWGWPSFQQNSVNYSVPDVRTIQYLLNARGAGLVVDGRFGPRTDAAVRSFQQSHGLAVDGIVGPHTWAALIITVQRGSTGSAVRALQDQLDSRYIGGPVLAVDGIFGP